MAAREEDQIDTASATTTATSKENEQQVKTEESSKNIPASSPGRSCASSSSASTSGDDSNSNSNSQGGDQTIAKIDIVEEVDTDDAATKAELYADWPMKDIKEPHNNDVLYGRGGGTNHHPGNKRYRKMVEGRKVDYVNSKRLDKPLVALDIIREWRAQVPPGRFLKMDDDSGCWQDVGDKKAREKTSQALREKAPLLRKQQEEQKLEIEVESNQGRTKSTRFNVSHSSRSSSKVSKNLSRVMLARDHSLGRDYLHADEPVSVRGFTWDNDDANTEEVATPMRAPSGGTSISSSRNRDRDPYHPVVEPPTSYAVHRSRSSSMNRQHSLSSNPLPGGSSTLPAINSFEENVNYSPGPVPVSTHPIPVESEWPQVPGNPHTPRESDMVQAAEWRGHGSEDAVRRRRYAPNELDYRMSRSAEDVHRRGGGGRNREYYYQNVQSDDYARFASLVGPPPEMNYMQGWTTSAPPGSRVHPDYSNSSHSSNTYQTPDRMPSGGYRDGANNWPSSPTSPHSTIHPYGAQNGPYHSGRINSNTNIRNMTDISGEVGGDFAAEASPVDESPIIRTGKNYHQPSPPSRSDIPRPDRVKRDTSHKNKTFDTEPTTKKMNRQRSIGNRSSSMSSLEEVTETDIKKLNNSLEQSTIRTPLRKPQAIASSNRLCTFDRFDVGIEGSSSPLDEGDDRPSSPENLQVSLETVPSSFKPSALTDHDRVSTLGSLDVAEYLLNSTAV